MRSLKILSLATFAGALAFTPLHADEWDKRTIITIDAPVQIPTTTLQPGTYTLKLLESQSDRHIVTVWDKDGMHLITTLLTVPNYRLKPTDKSKFTFWETSAGRPAALRAWFYPGENFGEEFAYPKAQAQQISMATHSQVPTMSEQDETKYGGGAKGTAVAENPVTTAAPAEPAPAPAADPIPAPVAAAPAPEATPAPVEAAPAPSPAPTPTPAPEQAPAASAPAADQTPATSAMPATASNTNEAVSLGLLLGLSGLATFLVRKKTV